VHYQQQFVVPGTKLERRAERKVAFWLLAAFLGGLGYLVVSIFWPWRFKADSGLNFLFTPLLGFCMALALGGLGMAVIGYAKWLMPHEESVQERHDGRSDPVDRTTTTASFAEMGTGAQLGRRGLIKRTLGLSVLGLTALAVAPLIGLFKKPGKQLFTTPWKNGVRLVRDDGTPIKPADMKPGSIQTVFPDVPGGNAAADAATMLIRLRPTEKVEIRKGRENYHYSDYFAYSKICTHAGCPVSLFQQQDNLLLCPCHQSQFNVLDGCRPIFGPASRSLPQLPIGVDEQGYFVAKSDYKEAVGPAFWERP
jgi:ubiquinol-cytochrome c reductase iron-sulfur subunit